MNRFPDALPELIGKFVEHALTIELSLGYDEFLTRVVASMNECRLFENPALKRTFVQLTDDWIKKATSPLESQSLMPEHEVTGPEDCQERLKRNPFGWFNKLDEDSRTGWLADADLHYKNVFPHLNHDSK